MPTRRGMVLFRTTIGTANASNTGAPHGRGYARTGGRHARGLVSCVASAAMSAEQLVQLHDAVEGIVYGMLRDAGIDPILAHRMSLNSSNYTVSEVKQVTT